MLLLYYISSKIHDILISFLFDVDKERKFEFKDFFFIILSKSTYKRDRYKYHLKIASLGPSYIVILSELNLKVIKSKFT